MSGKSAAKALFAHRDGPSHDVESDNPKKHPNASSNSTLATGDTCTKATSHQSTTTDYTQLPALLDSLVNQKRKIYDAVVSERSRSGKRRALRSFEEGPEKPHKKRPEDSMCGSDETVGERGNEPGQPISPSCHTDDAYVLETPGQAQPGPTLQSLDEDFEYIAKEVHKLENSVHTLNGNFVGLFAEQFDPFKKCVLERLEQHGQEFCQQASLISTLQQQFADAEKEHLCPQVLDSQDELLRDLVRNMLSEQDERVTDYITRLNDRIKTQEEQKAEQDEEILLLKHEVDTLDGKLNALRLDVFDLQARDREIKLLSAKMEILRTESDNLRKLDQAREKQVQTHSDDIWEIRKQLSDFPSALALHVALARDDRGIPAHSTIHRSSLAGSNLAHMGDTLSEGSARGNDDTDTKTEKDNSSDDIVKAEDNTASDPSEQQSPDVHFNSADLPLAGHTGRRPSSQWTFGNHNAADTELPCSNQSDVMDHKDDVSSTMPSNLTELHNSSLAGHQEASAASSSTWAGRTRASHGYRSHRCL